MNRMPAGVYHVALLLVAGTAFNWGFKILTQINMAQRIFEGIQVPENILAITICTSAVVVIWHNWVD